MWYYLRSKEYGCPSASHRSGMGNSWRDANQSGKMFKSYVRYLQIFKSLNALYVISSFLTGKPVDGTVDTGKYSFHEFGDKYVLVIKNVQFADSGTYKCSNILTVQVRHCFMPRVIVVVARRLVAHSHFLCPDYKINGCNLLCSSPLFWRCNIALHLIQKGPVNSKWASVVLKFFGNWASIVLKLSLNYINW